MFGDGSVAARVGQINAGGRGRLQLGPMRKGRHGCLPGMCRAHVCASRRSEQPPSVESCCSPVASVWRRRVAPPTFVAPYTVFPPYTVPAVERRLRWHRIIARQHHDTPVLARNLLPPLQHLRAQTPLWPHVLDSRTVPDLTVELILLRLRYSVTTDFIPDIFHCTLASTFTKPIKTARQDYGGWTSCPHSTVDST